LEDLGLSLVPSQDLPGSKTKDGVAISNVDPSSRAADQGLRRGDIIVEVNNKTVATVDDVIASIREAREKGKKNVLLQIRGRDRQQRYVALPIDQKLNRGKDKDKDKDAPKLEKH
jgi:serine protease Do